MEVFDLQKILFAEACKAEIGKSCMDNSLASGQFTDNEQRICYNTQLLLDN